VQLKDNHTKLASDEKSKNQAHTRARQAYADAVKQAEQATMAYKEGKRTNVLAKQLDKVLHAARREVQSQSACTWLITLAMLRASTGSPRLMWFGWVVCVAAESYDERQSENGGEDVCRLQKVRRAAQTQSRDALP
jgi:hypothetical protein